MEHIEFSESNKKRGRPTIKPFLAVMVGELLIDSNLLNIEHNYYVKMGTANKLRTYRANTLNYTTMVNYLQDVSNFKHINALSKLKASNH